MNKQTVKFIFIAIVLIFVLWNLYPSYKWFTMSQQEQETRERLKDPLVSKSLNLGLDIRGGMNLILELETDKLPNKLSLYDAQQQSIEIIRNRIDQFGVAEPLITRQGDKWITVQIPGIKDPDRAIDLIGKTALLEFKLVDDKIVVSDYMDDKGEIDITKVPEDIEIIKGKDYGYYALKKNSQLTGAMLSNAEVKVGGDYGAPYVALNFNREGAVRFSDITGNNINKQWMELFNRLQL
jgi:preprotein translocase subunit SecD